jgi:signal transduction histidine kinase/CheY-like chemotaxis protein
MGENIQTFADEYADYIYRFVNSGDEDTLYECSEFGKKLARDKHSVEDLVTLHQFCLESLGDLLNKTQLIKSFDLLTEITVQQTLWLKRETALKAEAKRMISDVIEAMPLSIYWKDTNGQYLGCNNAYLNDIGANNLEDLITGSSQWSKADSKYSLPLSDKELGILHKTQPYYHGERKLLLASGLTISIRESILPLTNIDQQLYGILCFYEDVTKLKNAEKENQRLVNDLTHSQRIESVGRLAGGIAHDFNNLLAVVIGYSQLMEKSLLKSGNNSKYIDYLQRILSAANKSKLLTEKLLSFSRKELVKPKNFEILEHIKSTLSTYETIIDEDIFISINAAGEYWVNADPSHIDQVLLNLIVNARDAMSENSELKQKRIDISLAPSKTSGFACLSVKDNGCGMSEQTKERIFEPFFTTKKDIGTGLGLSTVYAIVTQNKASIRVNIANDEGTEFIIDWPISTKVSDSPSLDNSHPPLTSTKTSRGDINIAVLEDDKQVRELLVSVLRGSGYKVLGYESSQLMFKELATRNINITLLVSDIVLSEDLNGKQVSEKFSEHFPDSKIVFVSGYSNEIISKKGILLEDVTLIKKPFCNDVLVSTIDSVLDFIG